MSMPIKYPTAENIVTEFQFWRNTTDWALPLHVNYDGVNESLEIQFLCWVFVIYKRPIFKQLEEDKED